MAITVYQTDSGRVPGVEYLPAGGITPKAGMVLKMAEGKLAAASGEDVPLYLSMAERDFACADKERIPVIRISPDIIFETETPLGFTVKPGGRAQLTADGSGLSAAAGGAAEVVYTDADVTRVRFMQANGA